MTAAPRTPPHSADAETSVLGAVLRESVVMNQLLAVGLKPGDFYSAKNQLVFGAMTDLYMRGVNPDAVLVAEELKGRGELDNAGGTEHLTQLWAEVPSAANALSYAKIVADKSMLRRLIAACRQGQEAAFQASDRPEDVIDRVSHDVYGIILDRNQGQVQPVPGFIRAILAEIDERSATAGQTPGIPSGFVDLDNLTNGWQPAHFIVLAARPSTGKTSLGLSFILHAAVDLGIPTLMFSLEMKSRQIVTNMLCVLASVEVGDFARGLVSSDSDAMERVNNAAVKLSRAKIFLDDTGALDVLQLRAKSRHMVQREGVKLIVVDYLQLMRGDRSAENRQQEVASISTAIKSLAMDLSVPVIALAQLNRQVESRAKPRPVLSDLRESGSIENDADVVMMLYREDMYQEADPTKQDVETLVIVNKNRIGKTGDAKLLFRKRFLRFENQAQGWRETQYHDDNRAGPDRD